MLGYSKEKKSLPNHFRTKILEQKNQIILGQWDCLNVSALDAIVHQIIEHPYRDFQSLPLDHQVKRLWLLMKVPALSTPDDDKSLPNKYQVVADVIECRVKSLLHE